jgi:hypothetical protein
MPDAMADVARDITQKMITQAIKAAHAAPPALLLLSCVRSEDIARHPNRRRRYSPSALELINGGANWWIRRWPTLLIVGEHPSGPSIEKLPRF